MSELPLGAARYEPAGPPPDEPPDAAALATIVEREALTLGFSRVGFAPSARLEHAAEHLRSFRENGFAGGMTYLLEGDRSDPQVLLPGAKSAVVVALSYVPAGLVPLLRADRPLLGQIARYAQGKDYHQVMKRKLTQLAERVATAAGRAILARACVDTAPLLERELARIAGLGFQGKSAMLIAPGIGSYVLLGELLLDVELAPAASTRRAEGCGTCRACLDACPTGAFVGPYVLDARRCLSYLTIEFDGTIPPELRRAFGTRVFGCDVCQEVCPFNASSRTRPAAPELSPLPRLTTVELADLLFLGSAGYRKLVRGSALRRASRTTLQRNAAIALGNTDDPRAVAPLTRALGGNLREIVRAHAAWALGELARHLDRAARDALMRAAADGAFPEVAREASSALARATQVAAPAGG
jgi:epoxyqueuosine reductase